MNLTNRLKKIKSVFIDTAPIIYYIEANPKFGPIIKDIFNILKLEKIKAYTSVITITEVLPKPVEKDNKSLILQFIDFLKHGENISLLEITESISEKAGILRGKYPFLKTIDAIQISAALAVDTDFFITNDIKLNNINEIKMLILSDYL